jgi:ADP-dependent NAD(P)H-hydrate dehydratase / NAD(P)H-hydrate epimerase
VKITTVDPGTLAPERSPVTKRGSETKAVAKSKRAAAAKRAATIGPNTPASTGRSASTVALPADDPELFEQDLAGLRRSWADAARRSPIGAEAMTGADLRAQAMGVPGQRLMEHAGAAVAAAAKALAEATGRAGKGAVLVLCGPGNNGGDGFVAARYLAQHGTDTAVVLVASAPRPTTADAARNWDRLVNEPRVTRIHAGVPRDLAVLGQDSDKASIVIDALLGTGVQGALRDPIRTAVEIIRRARAAGVPVLAVDTPTALDVTSGDPSDPVVTADLTVTFHRPKTGLISRRGAAFAGKVLVAPIGIPREADRG